MAQYVQTFPPKYLHICIIIVYYSFSVMLEFLLHTLWYASVGVHGPRIYYNLCFLIQFSGSSITKPWRICFLNILNVCFFFTTPTTSLWVKPILWISLVFLQLTPKITVTNNQSKDSIHTICKTWNKTEQRRQK